VLRPSSVESLGQDNDEPSPEAHPLLPGPAKKSPGAGVVDSGSCSEATTGPLSTAEGGTSSPSLPDEVPESAIVPDSLYPPEADVTPILTSDPPTPALVAEADLSPEDALSPGIESADAEAAEHEDGGETDGTTTFLLNRFMAVSIDGPLAVTSTAVPTALASDNCDSEWPDVEGAETEEHQETMQDGNTAVVHKSLAPSQVGVADPPAAVPTDDPVGDPSSPTGDTGIGGDACDIQLFAPPNSSGNEGPLAEPSPNDDIPQGADAETFSPLATSAPSEPEATIVPSTDTATPEETITPAHATQALGPPSPRETLPPPPDDIPNEVLPSASLEPESEPEDVSDAGLSERSYFPPSDRNGYMPPIALSPPSSPLMEQCPEVPVDGLHIEPLPLSPTLPPSSTALDPIAAPLSIASELISTQAPSAIVPSERDDAASTDDSLESTSTNDSLESTSTGAGEGHDGQDQDAEAATSLEPSEACVQTTPATPADASSSSPGQCGHPSQDDSRPCTPASGHPPQTLPGLTSPPVDDTIEAAAASPDREGIPFSALEAIDDSPTSPADASDPEPLLATPFPPSSPPSTTEAAGEATPEGDPAHSPSEAPEASAPECQSEAAAVESAPQSLVPSSSTILPPAVTSPVDDPVTATETSTKQEWAPSVPMASLLNDDDTNVRHSLSDVPSSPSGVEPNTWLSSQRWPRLGSHSNAERPSILSTPRNPPHPFTDVGAEVGPRGLYLRESSHRGYQQHVFATPGRRSRLEPFTSAIRHTVDTLVDPESPLSPYHMGPPEVWHSLSPPSQPQWDGCPPEPAQRPFSQAGSVEQHASEEDEVDALVQTSEGTSGPNRYPYQYVTLALDPLQLTPSQLKGRSRGSRCRPERGLAARNQQRRFTSCKHTH
jgi:hypothetical protein